MSRVLTCGLLLTRTLLLFKLPAGSTMDQLAMDLRAQLIPPKLQRRNVGIDVPTTTTERTGP